MSITRETRGGYQIGDSYARLLERFPLWKIRNETQYDRATSSLQDLIGRRELDADEAAYLDALTILIGEYENRRYSLDDLAKERTPLDVLKHLADSNGITQAELAKTLGIGASAMSMILSGDRPITANHARALGKRFNVDVGLFI